MCYYVTNFFPNLFDNRINDVVEKGWTTGTKKALVDYSSPNMSKEMHVGHLRSIVQGEFICRILERVGGYNVDRISHVGDFGTPLGNVIAYCDENNQSFDDISTPQQLTKIYTSASEKAKKDPNFPAKGLQATLSLQKGFDKEINEKWNRICQISRQGFKDIQDWFEVNPKECGESFYKDKLPSIVKLLQDKNLAVESDGAQCVFVPMGKQNVPYIVQKKDSSYLYATTDLAALQYRTQELNMNRIVYVTDTAQQFHFQQLFYLGEKLGWLNLPDGSKCQLDHAHFGAVLGEDGTRMRSREGAPVRLEDFITQAEERANQALQNASFNRGHTDIKKVAKAAIKYYELSNQRTQNYKFSFDHMLQFHGNTGVYLLYAYSRVISILEKLNDKKFSSDLLQLNPNTNLNLTHETEIALALHIIQFHDILEYSLQTLSANPLSDYLFVLASKFSKFYEVCPVLKSSHTESRAELCKATASILLQGFEVLNITPTRL